MREETDFKPKPLVEIGGRPILWHIMKIYAHHGHSDFVLPLGYKGALLREHFSKKSDFKIAFANTGIETDTGGRLLKIRNYLKEDAEFMVTYGDGVSDINLKDLVSFHRAQNTIGTIAGVVPYSKYGLVLADKKTKLATDFKQKPLMDAGSQYVNGGFMVFKNKIFDFLEDGPIEEVFPALISKKQLSVYVHKGFWMSMDTTQEMDRLNKLWKESRPWAVWES